MSNTPTCATGCGQPSPDAFLCSDCTIELERAITDLQAFIPELGVAASRQDNITASGTAGINPGIFPAPSATAERSTSPFLRGTSNRIALIASPNPVGWAAAELLAECRNTLSTWARHLAETRGVEVKPGTPSIEGPRHAWCMHTSCAAIRASLTSDQVITAFLLRSINSIRQDEAAGEIHRDLTRLARRTERAVDRGQHDVFCGKCNAADPAWHDTETDTIVIDPQRVCGAHLHAQLGDTHVECQACGSTYLVADRQEIMREAVRDVWERPPVIASALTAMGLELPLAKLENWIARDRAKAAAGQRPRKNTLPLILQVATDYQDDDGNDIMQPLLDSTGAPVVDDDGRPVLKQAGRPLYKLGDVLDRVTALAAIAAAKESERTA
jgi:DNA-directed RNA polymerase subunit RPC12/RpoP